MNKANRLVMMASLVILTACSPIKVPVNNQYTLEAFSSKKITKHQTTISILVSPPEAMAGNQTEQMRYIKKPFELEAFVHNAWVSAPANMLYPLITQSLQKTDFFYAVASGPYIDRADYRLDTQIITLHQNFLIKPSVVEFVAKVMLTHVADNRLVSSRVISERTNCPTDTPYGGVIAANKAVQTFTEKLSRFVIAGVQRDRSSPDHIVTSNSQKFKTIVQ